MDIQRGPLTFNHDTHLKLLYTLLESDERKKLVEEEKPKSLAQLQYSSPANRAVNVKCFEGAHFHRFAQVICPNEKQSDGRNLHDELIKQIGKPSVYIDFPNRPSIAEGNPKKYFEALAYLAGFSLAECFLEFLKLCKEEDRPLRIFEDLKDSHDYELKGVYKSQKTYLVPQYYIDELQYLIDEWRQGIPNCPYKGLKAFEPSDREYFYGRKSLTKEIVETIQGTSFYVLTGASGCGKSSLLLAGIAPALEDDGWLPITVRLTSYTTPLEALISGLVSAYINPELNSEFTKAINEFERQIKHEKAPLFRIIKKVADFQGRKILIIIDQFEELFTHNFSDDDIYFFVKLLTQYASKTESLKDRNAAIVLTLKSDFLPDINMYSDLASSISQNSKIVTPLNREELKEAIEKPAEKLKVSFQDNLVELILNDAEQEPNSLPLVQFMLEQLWETQEDKLLLHTSYHAIGRVSRAFSDKAEAIYDHLDKNRQLIAQWLFIDLVAINHNKIYSKRVLHRSNIDESTWQLVELFSNEENRLLVTNVDNTTDEATVQLAHETIIGKWEILIGWLEDKKDFIRWRANIEARLADWNKNRNDKKNLLSGNALNDAKEWLDYRLDNDIRELIERSIKNEVLTQRISTLVTVSLSLFALSITVLIILLKSSLNITEIEKDRAEVALEEAKIASENTQRALKQTELERNKAQASNNRYMVTMADRIMLDKEYRVPVLLALNAIEKEELKAEGNVNDSALNVLKSALGHYISLETMGNGDKGENDAEDETFHFITRDVVEFPELYSKITLTGSHLTSGKFALIKEDGSEQVLMESTAYSHMKKWLSEDKKHLFLKDHRSLKVFDITNDDIREVESYEFEDDIYSPTSSLISKNGKAYVITAVKRGDVDNYIFLGLVDDFKRFNEPIMSPVYQKPLLHKKSDIDMSFEFSEDERFIAIKRKKGRYLDVYKADNQKLVRTFTQGDNENYWVKFSPDKSSIILSTAWNDFTVKDLRTGALLLNTEWDGSALSDSDKGFNAKGNIKFAKGTSTFYDAGNGKSTKYWMRTSFPRGMRLLEGHGNLVEDIAFGKVSNLVATASKDLDARIWNRETGLLVTTLKGHRDIVTSILFALNDQFVITSSADSTIRIWSSQSGKLLQTLPINNGEINRISISDDERYLLAFKKTFDQPSISEIELDLNNLKFGIWQDKEVNAGFRIIDKTKLDGTYYDIDLWQFIKNRIYLNAKNGVSSNKRIYFNISESKDGAFKAFENRLYKYVGENNKKTLRVVKSHLIVQKSNDRSLLKLGEFKKGLDNVVISPDGAYVLTQNKSTETWNLWEVNQDTLKNGYAREFQIDQSGYARFSPDSKYIFGVTEYSKVFVFDIENGKYLMNYKVGKMSVIDLKMSHDSHYLSIIDQTRKAYVMPISDVNDKDLIDYYKSLNIIEFSEREKQIFGLQ